MEYYSYHNTFFIEGWKLRYPLFNFQTCSFQPQRILTSHSPPWSHKEDYLLTEFTYAVVIPKTCKQTLMWRSPLTFRLRRHPNMSVLRNTEWIFEWLVAIFLLRYSVLNCCTSVTHTYFETFKGKVLPFFQSPAAHLHTPVIFIQSHDIYIFFFFYHFAKLMPL